MARLRFAMTPRSSPGMETNGRTPSRMAPTRSMAVVYGAALVSAGAWAAAMGYGVAELGWIAFLPLWVAWDRTPVAPQAVLTHAAGPTLVAHGGAYVGAYPWIVHHATASGVQAGLSALLILTLLYSLPLMAGGRLALQGQPGTGGAVWMGGWILVDLVIQRGSWAFPWIIGAHAVVDSPATYSLVRLGGPVALTASIGLMHGGLFFLVRTIAFRAPVPWCTARRLGTPVGIATLLGGLLLLHEPPAPSSTALPTAPATVWAVQPNISPSTWAQAESAERRERLHTLTETALDTTATPPDLIVWPETALHPSDTTGMQALVTDWNAPLLTGAVHPVHASGTFTNAALLYSPNQPVQQYDKHYLVPFAETVPGATWWRALLRFAMDASDGRTYVPGKSATVLSHDAFSFVPLICFESVVSPALSSVQTLAQTRGVITISQTGWWNRAQPAQQHVQYSRLRAMETGRPLLIASVSGPTTLVDPSGTPTVLAPYGNTTVTSVQWPDPHPPGLYVRTAPYIDIAWTAIALLLVCVPVRYSS